MPAPPAPPPSPPAGANTNLLGPLLSETFTNDAVRAGTTFDKATSQRSNFSLGTGNFTIQYDAATKTYILARPDLQQSFGPSHITDENSGAWLYERTAGNVSDSLTLTKPGTSGPFTHTYVGAGIWAHTIETAATIDGSISAFTYGVETPDPATPRTGAATFGVDLLASDGLTQYVGAGNFTLDFSSGDFLSRFPVDALDSDGNVLHQVSSNFQTSGSLSSTANLFSGNFLLNSTTRFQGTLAGRLYGPGGQELGAAFRGIGSNAVVAGVLLGRRDETLGGDNLSLLNLKYFDVFQAPSSAVARYNRNLATNAYVRDDNPFTTNGLSSLTYSANNQSFRGTCCLSLGGGEFLESQKTFSADNRFIIYEQPDGDRLLLYRPGNANGELALTYTSFAILEHEVIDSANNRKTIHESFMPWGIRTTRTNNLPATGSASYAGRLYGTGTGSEAGYSLTGAAAMNVDFASSQISGSFHPLGSNLTTGAAVDFGSLQFSGGIDRTDASLRAGPTPQGSVVHGYFYGPAAAEFGAVFQGFNAIDPSNASDTIALQGVMVGKKN